MSSHIQMRRGTAAAWTAANPTLLSGEPGFETDTGYMKYGDGATAWVSLGYTKASPALASVSRFLSPSGGDDSAAMQAAINALPAAGGTILLGPGTFLWNTQVPALPRNAAVRILGWGVDQTTIKLSASAPRAFDYNKVADYDTFTGIELSDFTVDANNTTGQHHVVIGTYVGGVTTTKININRFAARRIRTINVTSDATTTIHRLNLYNVPKVNTADNACTLNDHVYEDLDFMDGGNQGLVVGASATAAPGNCTYARITARRIKHNTKLSNPASFSSANVQIGSYAVGAGPLFLDEIYGYGSGDVCTEVDNPSDCHIGTLVGTDPVNAVLYLANIAGYAPGSTQLPSQTVRVDYLKHHAIVVPGVAQTLNCATATPFGNVDVGTMELESHIVTGTHPNLIRNLSCASFDVAHAHYAISAANDAVTATTIFVMSVKPLVDMRCHIGSYTESLTGTYSAGSIQQFSHFDSANAVNVNIEIDSMTINNAMTVLHQFFFVGSSGVTNNTITGHVRGLRVKTSPAPFNGGIYFVATAAANMPFPFEIDNCNFTGMAGLGGGEIVATVAASADKSCLRCTNIRWQNGAPTPATAPTVGASPWTWKNITGIDSTLYLYGGTVSQVQCRGATVGGATGFGVRVPSGDSAITTYSVAPTARAVPDH